MGALMRAFDWRQTPIGPVAAWPQSLKTAVRIILTSRYAMFVWWGQELINLYNDPYRSFLGVKHPDALGKSARDVWAEIWDQIGPRTDAVLFHGESTYDEALLLLMERYGYLEETYFTFSYSPLPDDKGGVGGLFCAVTEDTQRVIGERRLRLLREMASRDGGSSHARTGLSGGRPILIERAARFALQLDLSARKRRQNLAKGEPGRYREQPPRGHRSGEPRRRWGNRLAISPSDRDERGNARREAR